MSSSLRISHNHLLPIFKQNSFTFEITLCNRLKNFSMFTHVSLKDWVGRTDRSNLQANTILVGKPPNADDSKDQQYWEKNIHSKEPKFQSLKITVNFFWIINFLFKLDPKNWFFDRFFIIDLINNFKRFAEKFWKNWSLKHAGRCTKIQKWVSNRKSTEK